jgi:hypothetical protein
MQPLRQYRVERYHAHSPGMSVPQTVRVNYPHPAQRIIALVVSSCCCPAYIRTLLSLFVNLNLYVL